jgi:hypothetical protein
MERAREAGVPLVCGPHRKAAMSPVLERQGFPALTLVAEGKPQPIDVTQAAIMSLPASVILDLPPLDQPAEQESLMRVPVVTVPPAPLRLKPTEDKVYQSVLPLVAANPWFTVAEIAEKTDHNATALFQPVRAARLALGIKAGQGAAATRIVNRALYESVCATLGVVPTAEDASPTRAPGTAHTRAGGWRAAVGQFPLTAPVPAKVGSEFDVSHVAPVPEAPAPPSPAPVAALLPGEAAKDTLEALRLLLEAMRAEGVESVTVSDDGKVNLRRRIVITSSLTI